MIPVQQILAVSIYITFLILIAIFTRKENQTSADFILGSRSLNFWLTALAAHASDMSSWIFLAYPAAIYAKGMQEAWIALGLIFYMFLNWQLIAPRLRTMTEKYNSLTLSSFLESRTQDTTGYLRLFTALIAFVYYAVYISAGLVGLGFLLQSLFGMPYILGIAIGVCIIVPYLFVGGYITLAWTDFFQGFFLLFVIVFVPFYALGLVGGVPGIQAAIARSATYDPFLAWDKPLLFTSSILTALGWGLGYFGQLHILTKFMGIKNPDHITKSKWLGMTWMTIAIGAATLIGLIGIPLFETIPLVRDEYLFADMTLYLFPPFISGFILCAILGATITSIDSMILVVASNMAEDVYKRLFRKNASSNELLIVSRLSILLIALLSFGIAATTTSSLLNIVSYAWFGLGAAFGPLILFSLYAKRINRYGAWTGALFGALIAGIWPLINKHLPIEIPTLIPGFCLNALLIWSISALSEKRIRVT